jgi:uncharacterized damage-inducible protein DinB
VNATEMLAESHLMVIQALDDLPEEKWDVPNVCGNWSTKEVIAHLASYENALLDILKTFDGQQQTTAADAPLQNREAFNAREVGKRRYDTAQHVLDEYNDVQVQTESLLAQLSPAQVTRAVSMPWYSMDRSLSDLITTLCRHSSDHVAQIKAFRASRGV